MPADAGDGRDVHRSEFASLILEIAGYGDHRRIVGREPELGQERPPAPLAALFRDRVAQSRVGRNASGDRYVADIVLLGRFRELGEQDVDDRRLQRGA